MACSWLWVALTLGYFILFEASGGGDGRQARPQPRVRQRDGSPVDFESAVLRNLMRLVDCFPYFIPYLTGALSIWAGTASHDRQQLGDRSAGTMVIWREAVESGLSDNGTREPEANVGPPSAALLGDRRADAQAFPIIWVTSGLVLIGVAVILGVIATEKATGQSNTDFAHCVPAPLSPECRTQSRPLNVMWTRSSDTGFQKRYEVDVQTGTHTSISFTDLTETDVAPVQDLTSVEVLYRSDRPVAVIWPDGTPIQIPVALTHGFWISGLVVGLPAASARSFCSGASGAPCAARTRPPVGITPVWCSRSASSSGSLSSRPLRARCPAQPRASSIEQVAQKITTVVDPSSSSAQPLSRGRYSKPRPGRGRPGLLRVAPSDRRPLRIEERGHPHLVGELLALPVAADKAVVGDGPARRKLLASSWPVRRPINQRGRFWVGRCGPGRARATSLRSQRRAATAG